MTIDTPACGGPPPTVDDAFGLMLAEAWRRCRDGQPPPRSVFQLVERDDGMLMVGLSKPYFAEPRGWIQCERHALGWLHGRVLDIGAGAGRLALRLQADNIDVTALDSSPAAVDVCRRRGVRHTVRATLDGYSHCGERYDCLALFGNGVGLLESGARAPDVLATLARLAAPGGSVVAIGTDPTHFGDPATEAYHERNLRVGRLPGEWRVRERFRNLATPWFDFLWLSVTDLERLVVGSPWRLADVDEGAEGTYAARLVLRSRSADVSGTYRLGEA